jgi:hypothetical protein
MANELTLGRLLPQKNNTGGIQAIYFVNRGDLTGYTMDATNTDTIEAVTGAPSCYKYEVKNTSTGDSAFNGDIERGVMAFDQSLKLTFPKLTIPMQKEIKLMAWGQPLVVVKTNNNEYFMYGKEFGMDVVGGTITHGAKTSDMSGYTLELKGSEAQPPSYFEATTDALLTTAGFTIVLGS